MDTHLVQVPNSSCSSFIVDMTITGMFCLLAQTNRLAKKFQLFLKSNMPKIERINFSPTKFLFYPSIVFLSSYFNEDGSL